jgi:hypothetical protein
MAKQQVKINKADDLLRFEWQLLMSINESGRGITTSLLSYFITLNLGIYGGIAWVGYNAGFNQDWKWILLMLLGTILLILNISIFQIYLRNYLYASDNWKQVEKIRNFLINNKEPEWRIEEFKRSYKDPYKGLTHKTFSFVISFFTAASFSLLIIFIVSREGVAIKPEYILLFIIVFVITYSGLYINSQNKVPALIGMKDC